MTAGDEFIVVSSERGSTRVITAGVSHDGVDGLSPDAKANEAKP